MLDPIFPVGAIVWWPEHPPEGTWQEITLRQPLEPGQFELPFEEEEEDDMKLWRRVE